MELWRLIITDPHYTRRRYFRNWQGRRHGGIVPLLTFSSPEIAPADLGDSACNEVLAMAEEVGGGVIVSSPLLRIISGRIIPGGDSRLCHYDCLS